MTPASDAAQLIARYVGKQYPDNKDELFALLTLVNDKIWKEGSWWGMQKEFFVRTRKGPNDENYIVCPPGYDILKAVNINGRPVLPRDKWFQFHQNACGSIDKCCGNWTQTSVDLGEYPTINDIHTETCRPDRIWIGACLTGGESAGRGAFVRITGEWDRGGEVYTYKRESVPENKVEVLNEDQKWDTVFGAKIALNDKIRIINNIHWKSINAIYKTVTANPVEVYAVHNDSNSTLQLLAVIPPQATRSRHRRYLVPDDCCYKPSTCNDCKTGGCKSCSDCNCNCTRCVEECDECNCCAPVVHGIFKVSKPDPIVYDTQDILTDDRETIISLAIGMNEMFDKKNPQQSIPFLLNGIKNLEDDNRENQSTEVTPVQVVGSYMEDIPEILKHYSH